jgi:Meckel syndrome type 1 protein
MAADFAALLAGLIGVGEPEQGGAPEGAMAPSVEAMADTAMEGVTDGAAEAAGVLPDMTPGTPPAAPPPLTIPDLLARMAPEAAPAPKPQAQSQSQSQPIPAAPGSAPTEAAAVQGAINPLGDAPSTSPSPPVPEIPAATLPAAAVPATSGPDRAAGQVAGAVATATPTASGSHVAAAASQPVTPQAARAAGPTANAATEAPDAPPDTAAAATGGMPPPGAAAVIATAHAPAPARPGRIAAESLQPASASTEAAPQADTPRALPGAALPFDMGVQAEAVAIAPIATATDQQVPAPTTVAPPDPRHLPQAETTPGAPETIPSAAAGGASVAPLAAPAPEPLAAPARPTAPIPWPARQVAPFAVSLALGSDDTISLTLEPVALGRVEVAIARGAEAHISLRAERPETLALLQRDRAELERALAGTGFNADGRAPSLSFGLGFGAGGDERRDRRPAGRDSQGARPAIPTPAPAIHQAAPTARGLIDIAF